MKTKFKDQETRTLLSIKAMEKEGLKIDYPVNCAQDSIVLSPNVIENH